MTVPRVAGKCPMGCGETLILGTGGHVTCSYLGCPRPAAPDELLHLHDDHVMEVGERSFTIEHPTRERLVGTMHECPAHSWARKLPGPAVRPGRYRMVEADTGFRLIPEESADG